MLFSIVTCASVDREVISQSHPCALPPVRVRRPRLALIFEPEFIGGTPVAARGWPTFRRREW
jgi:hypothetical protein